MSKTEKHGQTSFFERPAVEKGVIPIGSGIPFGIEQVSNTDIGIGGAYGTWGNVYDNDELPNFIESRLGEPLHEGERMALDTLGFTHRHHLPDLSNPDHLELEVAVGAQLLLKAAAANGWKSSEVDGVLIGMSGPVSDDYVERIAQRAGVPKNAIKVSVHKACDSSMGALNLILNPRLADTHGIQTNLAEELSGKKVLVGGIEGLSRFTSRSRDKNALQLFGNGAGVIGVIPGQTMNFLVGKDHEVFDEEGVLAVHMDYPHSGRNASNTSLIEVTNAGHNHIRVAGLMHEPDNGSSVVMAGPMGMVKLFVRTGVEVVHEVYEAYQKLIDKMNLQTDGIRVAIVHHANYKINLLKAKHLSKLGIHFPMPWLASEFGNVSAASNMIAFLRQLPKLRPGDHILFDGFGAGTYYDVIAVAMGE